MSNESFWIDGKIYNRKEAIFNLEIGALHYGSSVFEGILSVKIKERSENKVVIFHLKEHIQRLLNSANILGLNINYSQDEVIEAVKSLIKFNGLNNYYIRPILFSRGDYSKLFSNRKNTTLGILLHKFNFKLFKLKMYFPISLVCLDKFIIPFTGKYASLKASGRYLINILAKKEADSLGYDDAVLFDIRGNLAETTTANIFMVKDNKVITPLLGNIIDGITRKTVIELLSDMDVEVKQEDISKEELLNCDAFFLTGTATGIVSVKQIDKKRLNFRHRLIVELQNRYLDIITAKEKAFQDYITYIS